MWLDIGGVATLIIRWTSNSVHLHLCRSMRIKLQGAKRSKLGWLILLNNLPQSKGFSSYFLYRNPGGQCTVLWKQHFFLIWCVFFELRNCGLQTTKLFNCKLHFSYWLVAGNLAKLGQFETEVEKLVICIRGLELKLQIQKLSYHNRTSSKKVAETEMVSGGAWEERGKFFIHPGTF